MPLNYRYITIVLVGAMFFAQNSLAMTDLDRVKGDESVQFFASDAYFSELTGQWHIDIHGWIYEPEKNSLWRSGAEKLLGQSIHASEGEEQKRFEKRIRPFLVDNERAKIVSIRIGEDVITLRPSAANGHFLDQVRLSQQALGNRGWHDYQAELSAGDDRHFGGRFQLVPPVGYSVISDIDDTIKQSNVSDHDELIANTFIRPFRAVPKMAALYQEWQQAGALFHYVSASPWQLYQELERFREKAGFPAGSYFLRPFRLKDESFIDFLQGSSEYKFDAIERLLKRYPERSFLLVGDSGEKDPEIYAQLALRYPRQISLVLIRNVTAESADSIRIKRAFKGVPRLKWMLFSEAAQLTPVKDEIQRYNHN